MKREKMPRKMKKRFKKLMKFFEIRKKEYEKQTTETFLKSLIIVKIIGMGIAPDSISDIKIKRGEKDIQAVATLLDSMESVEITVNVEG